MPRIFLVIRPVLPKSSIMERDSTNGGDTTGSRETTSNSFFVIRLRICTYTST